MNTRMQIEGAIRIAAQRLSGLNLPVRACAKVNLRLKIEGRRPDGYHLLSMLNATIDLCDEVVIRFIPEPLVNIRIEPDGVQVGPDEDNLVVRAFRYFWQELGLAVAPIGFECCITKNIPIGAGLGGGSSDAAAMLRVLSSSFAGAVCSAGSLRQGDVAAAVMRAAARCGADVPYAYTGGLAWVSGVGEVVQPVFLPSALPGLIIVMVPPEPVATAAFYESLRASRPVIEPYIDRQREQFLNHPSYDVLQQIVANDFEDEVVRMAPSVGVGLEIARRFYPKTSAVTGSGSAFFALVPPGQEGSLTALEQELSGVGVRVFRSRFIP
jgi:4-diphosphocytidyl-2-C-methyl-D-erythritol kinase